METQKLKGLLSSQIQAALEKAQDDFAEFIDEVNTIACNISVAFRFGEVYAPKIYPKKCIDRHLNSKAKNKPLVEAIGHYQGNAHGTLTEVALNAARRLHRQKRPAKDYAALQVAIDLLRFVVNARADMARLEAAAGEGPFAFRKPQVEMFHQVEERLRNQAAAVFIRLEACPSPQDIVQMSVGQVRAELAKPQTRVRMVVNQAEEKAKKLPKEHLREVRLRQVQNCRSALTEAEKLAKAADPLSIDEVGQAAEKYYGVVNRFPWYFGVTPRRQNKGGKGKQSKAQPKKEAKAS